MFKMKWLTVLVWLSIAASPSFAADPVAGVWKLVSFEREYQATGDARVPDGLKPRRVTSCSVPERTRWRS